MKCHLSPDRRQWCDHYCASRDSWPSAPSGAVRQRAWVASWRHATFARWRVSLTGTTIWPLTTVWATISDWVSYLSMCVYMCVCRCWRQYNYEWIKCTPNQIITVLMMRMILPASHRSSFSALWGDLITSTSSAHSRQTRPKLGWWTFFCVIATSSFLWRQWPPRTKKLTISCWTYIRRRPLILYECQYGCSKITLHSESTYQSCTRIPGCGSINPCSSIDDFQKSNSMFTFDYPLFSSNARERAKIYCS